MAVSSVRSARIRPLHYATKPALRDRPSFPYLVGLAVYLAIALWLTGMPGHDFLRQMLNQGSDQQTAVFFLKWWPWAILHGQNPFEIRQLAWPATYDAAWMTSIAAPALLGAPVTLLFGPIATWNLWLLLAPITASLAMLTLLDTLELPIVPAVAGGFLFGFSTYVVAEMEDHLFLTLVFPLPLLAAVLIKRLRGQIEPAWFVVLTTLLLSFLVYTSTEMVATVGLACVLALILLLIWYRQAVVTAMRKLGRELLVIAAGCAAIGAPLLAYALAQATVANSPFQTPDYFSINLLNFVIPNRATLIGGRVAPHFIHFTGNPPEQAGYLGILLIGLCVAAIWQGRRQRRWVAPLAIWTVALAVLALGPQLRYRGMGTGLPRSPGGFPLPWKLATYVPVLKIALPSRLMVFVALGVATLAALWTSWATSPRQRKLRNVALITGAILLLPNPAAYRWQAPDIVASANDGSLAAFVPPHTGLLLLPQTSHAGALWSEASDFRVALTLEPRGYDPSKPGYMAWPLSTFDRLLTPPPNAPLQLEAFSATHDDGAIAVPDGAPAWVKMLNALGWTHRHVPGATVYRLPTGIRRAYRHATPAHLQVAFYRTEVEALEKAGACYLRRGGPLASLRPATAVARHCLSPAFLSDSPASNWTDYHGWLGALQGQVGVGLGLARSGKLAAKVFARTPAPKQWLVYDPKPRNVTLAGMQSGPPGTYLAVGPYTSDRPPTYRVEPSPLPYLLRGEP